MNKIFKYIDMHYTQSKQICNYVNNCPVQSVSLTKNWKINDNWIFLDNASRTKIPSIDERFRAISLTRVVRSTRSYLTDYIYIYAVIFEIKLFKIYMDIYIWIFDRLHRLLSVFQHNQLLIIPPNSIRSTSTLKLKTYCNK